MSYKGILPWLRPYWASSQACRKFRKPLYDLTSYIHALLIIKTAKPKIVAKTTDATQSVMHQRLDVKDATSLGRLIDILKSTSKNNSLESTVKPTKTMVSRPSQSL